MMKFKSLVRNYSSPLVNKAMARTIGVLAVVEAVPS